MEQGQSWFFCSGKDEGATKRKGSSFSALSQAETEIAVLNESLRVATLEPVAADLGADSQTELILTEVSSSRPDTPWS
jgi:hypothetical protein